MAFPNWDLIQHKKGVTSHAVFIGGAAMPLILTYLKVTREFALVGHLQLRMGRAIIMAEFFPMPGTFLVGV